MRYELLGLIPEEREANTTSASQDEQERRDEQIVYRTNSAEEARAIQIEGGFIRDGQWVVVTGVRDTEAPAVSTDIPAAPHFPER